MNRRSFLKATPVCLVLPIILPAKSANYPTVFETRYNYKTQIMDMLIKDERGQRWLSIKPIQESFNGQ